MPIRITQDLLNQGKEFNKRSDFYNIAKYIDNEIVDKIPGWKKWLVGSGIGMMLSNSNNIFEQVIKNNQKELFMYPYMSLNEYKIVNISKEMYNQKNNVKLKAGWEKTQLQIISNFTN